MNSPLYIGKTKRERWRKKSVEQPQPPILILTNYFDFIQSCMPNAIATKLHELIIQAHVILYLQHECSSHVVFLQLFYLKHMKIWNVHRVSRIFANFCSEFCTTSASGSPMYLATIMILQYVLAASKISFLLCSSCSEHFQLANVFIILWLKSSASSCKRIASIKLVRISSSYLSSSFSVITPHDNFL